jgi:hypothetical protein
MSEEPLSVPGLLNGLVDAVTAGGSSRVDAPQALTLETIHHLWGQLQDVGIRTAVIALRGPEQVKDQALGQLARAFEFPGWFGWNWDALLDCLRALDPGAGPYCALVTRPDETFTPSDEANWRTLLEILDQAAKRASVGGANLTVVVV